MISVTYIRLMAAYNAEMNLRLYEAADRLGDEERKADRGAFWRSIHGTLNHLLWADQMWMSRLSDWPRPAFPLAASGAMIDEFRTLFAERRDADARLGAWAQAIDEDWLAGRVRWFSGAARRDASEGRSLVLTHLFNHQTHHRGQAHALITRAGETTGDTDLWLVVPQSTIAAIIGDGA